MKSVMTAAAVAALLAAPPAFAQDVFFQAAVPPDGPAEPNVLVFGAGPALPGPPLQHRIEVLGLEPLDAAATVTDAPYSAQIVTEVVQPLADGNRIERRTTSSVARDSRGRVRREQPVAAIGPLVPQGDAKVVMLIDPVAKAHYTLDETRRVATKMPVPIVRRLQSPPGEPDQKVEAGTHVEAATRVERRTRIVGGPLPPALIDRLPETLALTAAPRQEVNVEKLGTMQLEGVAVEGTRTTLTIPAGQIGNEAPIEVVSERWYSPELKTVVYSRRSDPRFGETTYRLEHIVRAEPPPELFRVPPDYKVETARPFTRALPGAPPR